LSAKIHDANQNGVLAVRIVSDSELSHPTFEKIAGEYCAQFTVDLIRAMR